MKTIDEILKECEHDGSYIPVSEVKRLMQEYNQTLSIELSFTYGRIDELKEQFQKRDELIKLMYQMIVDYSNKKYKHSVQWAKEWDKVEQLKREIK